MTTVQNARGVAVTTDAKSAVQTVRVINQITGQNVLRLSLVNAGSTDRENVVIQPGIWAVGSKANLPENVSLTAKNFASRDEFLAYYAHISTAIGGARLETTNTENFNGFLHCVQKDPTGKEHEVDIDLSRFRQPLGTGYSETMNIPEQEMNLVLWPGLRVELSRLKANSTLHINFNVSGMSKTQELAPLAASIL